jgi:hypothetical protein
MIGLFVSNGCSTCKKIIRDIPDSWAGQIMVLRVEFDEEARYYRVYNGDKPLEGKAPINTVPTLWFSEENKTYQGYSKIMNRLVNVDR